MHSVQITAYEVSGHQNKQLLQSKVATGGNKGYKCPCQPHQRKPSHLSFQTPKLELHL